MNEELISFPCLRVEQPIGVFYIGVINASDLVSISYADVRRRDGRDIERYIGTQRDLSDGRVLEIRQYVTNVDACFPTGIIVAVNAEHAIYDENSKTLKITRSDDIAKIIDGQHRIAGLDNLNIDRKFQINLTIFIDMDLEDQAMVFATINLKQTKVTKSLAYDLYEYTVARSPQKTCHNIAKLVHFRDGSPFKGRIKILGKATGTGFETITQSTFVDRLLKLISGSPANAMKDKDFLKRRKPLPDVEYKKVKALIFRERFKNDKDAEIAKILWNYFSAVQERWPDGWKNFDRGFVLSRTTGFAAFIRLLPRIWNDMGRPTGIPKISEFLNYFNKSELKDTDFTSDNFKPGSSGEGALLHKLIKEIL